MFYRFVVLMVALTFSTPFGIFAQQNFGQTHTKGSDAILLMGDYQGIDEADAQSAALLVAIELRKQGISVGDPVYETHVSASVYQVSFRRLGGKILVRLTQEIPIGTIIIERQLWITDIEEMIEAAPRLVEALVHKKTIASTADIESVIESDTPMQRKIKGDSFWSMGLFGTSVPGTNLNAELGVEVGLSYERPSYAVETEFRLSGGEEPGGDSFIFGSWSIGGLYFFNKQNISPYVGGGLALVGANYRTIQTHSEDDWFRDEWYYDDDYDSEGDSGLGIYFIGGIQMLRLSRSRLKLELRVDRPFFQLPTQDVMPITLGIFYSSNYILGDLGF